jgi:hypothetical protein
VGLTRVTDLLKANLFNLLAFAILACFIGVWVYIMKQVADFHRTDELPTLELATGVVSLAGLLSTTIATITASALGFTIAEVKARATADSTGFDARAVGAATSTPTLLAILAYTGVAVAVFFTWVANEDVSPEVLSVFALSSIGWLVGSAPVVFKSAQT